MFIVKETNKENVLRKLVIFIVKEPEETIIRKIVILNCSFIQINPQISEFKQYTKL